ncbi:FAD-binding oxidoreductase [Nonomuraea sp. MG754425]|uniref:FAD-binding oxidoreductase n=1 Tax=Nonomuraea sp. MG754425 TaxID=2570319 RepID=UPI001F2D0ECF|nr:FAD-binding oxidoreductase [Nonomuraea sp. MG754425]
MELGRDLQGPLVRRGEAGYEALRAAMVWNGLKPERFPDVIVQAASERDVRTAVRFARSAGLRVAVRSGGHNWVGSSVRDGGLLIDLSRLDACAVDTTSATASAQSAVRGRELAAALAGHGLAFPFGHCGSVAIGGYLLSGGLGWNPGVWGPACLSVAEIEAVTASGEVVRCDEDENADLFWAARGAGPGFFAIVTRFRLRLSRLPAAITTSAYAFPLPDVADVTSWAVEVAAALPPAVELSLTLGTAPQEPGTKAVVVTAVCFADSADETARSLAAFRACPLAGRALTRSDGRPATFGTLFDGSDALWPEHHRVAADTLWSTRDLGALLPPLADDVAAAPSGKSLVLANIAPAPPGGAADLAFSMLGRSYVVGYAIWQDPAHDQANTRWLRATMDRAAPQSAGHYIAEADLPAAASRSRRSFTPETWERLRAVRARWDPEGVFQPYLEA